MDFGARIVKYMVFGFNLLLSIVGLIVVVIGALVQAEIKYTLDKLEIERLSTPSIAIIIIGVVVFIAGTLGCCGAAIESHCALISYSALLSLIFVAQAITAAFAFAYRKGIENVIEKSLEGMFSEYNINSDYAHLVDDIQQMAECCGIDGPEYWLSSQLPQSCCMKNYDRKCEYFYPELFKKGCLSAITDITVWSGNVVAWLAIGTALLEVLGIIFACCLANCIKNESRRLYLLAHENE